MYSSVFLLTYWPAGWHLNCTSWGMSIQSILIPQSALSKLDLVCFSHLRWDFVYQRPQHLISRFGKNTRAFFIEEPVFGHNETLHVKQSSEGVYVVIPHLPHGLDEAEVARRLRNFIDELFVEKEIEQYALWYYTPMALAYSDHLDP